MAIKKFVFVLMPFSEKFNDIYTLGIKNACADLDVYCERVDEQFYEGSMLERIYNQINHADYIIADMTSQNPNVFYEVGYAHALNKKVILITQDGNDIPFDMKHFLHIIYSNNKITDLNNQIQKRIRYYIDNESAQVQPILFNLDIYLHGEKLLLNEVTKINVDLAGKSSSYSETIKYTQDISLALNNYSESEIVNASRANISLIISNKLPFSSYSCAVLPNNMQIVYNVYGDKMYPEQWWSKKFEISFDSSAFDVSKIFSNMYNGQVNINLPDKTLKYPFELSLNQVIIN